MARAGSINYQVSNIIKDINGIGQSKNESRNESGLRAENGHKVSDKIHSYKSLDNTRADLANLARFAKSEFQIKDMRNINASIVDVWIKSKEITYQTGSNYLSEISKVSGHLSITKDEIKTIRAELRHNKPANQRTETRSYKGLDKVQVLERSQPAFELQRDYGLRVSAATHINLDKQLNGNTLKYQEKGGKWSEKELSDALANKIKENAVNGKYEMNNRTYNRDLKIEIEKQENNKYNGTHGIRHSYAQNQLESGKSKQEVSESMGHVREEIIDTYLR